MTRRADTSNRAAWARTSGTGPAIPSGAKCTLVGANMDNMETHDERPVIPWTCFSVEPALYLPDFGVGTKSSASTGGAACTAIVPLSEKVPATGRNS